MTETQQRFVSDDGASLFLRRWTPDVPVRAVVHIVHGMSEHSFRYDRFARRLAGCGFEVWAADQRGHGKTADSAINAPEQGGLLGHCADTDSISRVAKDIDAINMAIRRERSGTPLFLLGHSWGSFIAQRVIETFDTPLDGCILSGTRGPGGLQLTLGAPFLRFFAPLRGPRTGSLLVQALAGGAYNKHFKPNRTPFDWLSRDEAEVDAQIADPLCGFVCSTGFYRDMVNGLLSTHTLKNMERINRRLPIYIFSGSADPVGDMGKSPTALVNRYRSLGITDLEFVLYPDARHEVLNETNREEVMDNLISWIERHLNQGSDSKI